MNIQITLSILALCISLAAATISGLSLYGTWRAGAFDKPEYSTNVQVELTPARGAYQLASAGEPLTFVSLRITNHHDKNEAVINDIGGILNE